MKKAIIILVAALLAGVAGRAQVYYIPVNYVDASHITIGAGVTTGLNAPIFLFGDEFSSTEVKPQSFSSSLHPAFSWTLNSCNELTSWLTSGLDLSLTFGMNDWEVLFDGATFNNPAFNYKFYGKYNDLRVALGNDFGFPVFDKVELMLGIGVGMDIIFYGQCRGEAIRAVDGVLYPDSDVNEWHSCRNHPDRFPMSVDFIATGKAGIFYHLTETMSLGVVGICDYPILATGKPGDFGLYADNAQTIGYYTTVFNTDVTRVSLLASLRIGLN